MTPMQTALIEALRSGEYEQAQRRLRRGNAFCCLGVACDVALKEELVDGTWEKVDGNLYYFEVVGGPESLEKELSYELMELFGMDTKLMNSCIHMNDDDGRSFTEIADYLERVWSS